MKIIWVLIAILTLAACANKSKIVEINTDLKNTSSVAKDEQVGVTEDNEVVHQKTLSLSRDLRRLEQQVAELEDRVYGTRKYNTTGIWGDLRECAAKKKKLDHFDVGPAKRLSDIEPDINLVDNGAVVAVDSKSQKIVVHTQEKIASKIERIAAHRKMLQDKEDEIQEKLRECQQL